MGFYFNQARCSGCFTCVLACQQWHGIDRDSVQWRWVTTLESGEFPEVSLDFLSLSCCHCAKPACIEICPVNAIHKREDGVVLIDQESCLGKDSCGQCLDACPYKAPKFDQVTDAKAEMCNFCVDRLAEGKEPLCVAACPCRALEVGPLDQLKEIYGALDNIPGFVVSSELRPSIVFKRK
ncbi:4Fe-4S dicluster domain-containing protein [Chloroflexota bacterium]